MEGDDAEIGCWIYLPVLNEISLEEFIYESSLSLGNHYPTPDIFFKCLRISA